MIRKPHKLTLMTALTSLLLSNSAVAATAEETKQFDLDTVVVTATKTEKSIKDVPAAVTVITAEDMKKSNVRTLSDALRNVPGLYIKEQSGMKGTKISIRGLSQNRVLFLQDGMPLNNGYTGGPQWSGIPIDSIERVEIIRGPFSALYGSSAMGGVVNIITKEAAKPETTVTAGTGTNGTHSQTFSHNGVEGKLEYYLNYSKNDTDGYILNPANPDEGKFGSDNKQYSGKIIYHINATDKLIISKGRSEGTYQYSIKTDRGNRTNETLKVGYQAKLAPDKMLNFRFSELNFSDYWTITGKNYNTNPVKTREGEVNLNWKINPNNTLTVGVSSKVDKCDGKTYLLTNPRDISSINKLLERSGGKTTTNSIYFQDEMEFTPQTTMLVGGRYDNWKFTNGYNLAGSMQKKSENNFSPKASLLFKADASTTWYASAGKSFSSPSIFNLSRRWDVTRTLLLPNPDLKPEKANSYELGVTHKVSPNTTAKVSVFQNNVTDMIYQSFIRMLTADKQELQWKNAGKAEIKGIELELNHKFSPETSGYINYTHNNSKITANSDTTLVGKQVPTVPKDAFNIGFTYQHEKLTANLEGRYLSRTYESDNNTEPANGYGAYEPFFVVDTKFSYRFTPDTAISLEVSNLFDRQYYRETLAAGRTVFVELTQKF